MYLFQLRVLFLHISAIAGSAVTAAAQAASAAAEIAQKICHTQFYTAAAVK